MQIFVIDVAAGDDIPRKGGPGIARADLLVINKTDLAPYVGADPIRMVREASERRGALPVHAITLRKHGPGPVAALGPRPAGRVPRPRPPPLVHGRRARSPPPRSRALSASRARRLGPGRVTLVRKQAGPLAGDHDRVEIVVESGTLHVEPIAATVALPGPERTLLELDVTVGEGARLVLDDAPLIVAEGANVLRTVTIRLAPGAVATVRDLVILGRAGERPGTARVAAALRRHPARRAARRAGDVGRGRVRRARARASRDRDGTRGWACRATSTAPARVRRSARPMSRQHVMRGGSRQRGGVSDPQAFRAIYEAHHAADLRVLRAPGAA